MSEEGRIGPNALLQLIPLLDQVGGVAFRTDLLARADVYALPDGTQMIPEGVAARVHQEMRRTVPDLAPALSRAAGRATAAYILAHRIPAFARTVLRVLPAPVAARLLSRAIADHAWTFAGTGAFKVVTPYCFEIRDNPVIRYEVSDRPVCDWHAAVFAHLYQQLVHPDVICVETHCAAVSGGVCRFELMRDPSFRGPQIPEAIM